MQSLRCTDAAYRSLDAVALSVGGEISRILHDAGVNPAPAALGRIGDVVRTAIGVAGRQLDFASRAEVLAEIDDAGENEETG